MGWLPRRATWIFAAVVLAEFVAIGLQPQLPLLRYATKPLLVGWLLVVWVRTTGVRGAFPVRFALGLVLALLGDLALIPGGETFFLVGVGFFLLAQLCYAWAFQTSGDRVRGLVQRQPKVALPVLLYASALLYEFWPHLGDLALPVAVYVLGICTMALAMINRSGRVDAPSYWAGLVGMLFFLLSDSLLGWNRFVSPLPGADYVVMGTYALAQYWLTAAAYHQHRA